MDFESLENDSDVSFRLEQYDKNKRPKPYRADKNRKKQINKHDLDGDVPVKCRFCLKTECRLDNIIKHVKNQHADFWEPNTSRNTFVAKEGQTVPDDPKCLDLDEEEEKEDSQSCKKTEGNIPELIDEFFPEDFPMSQDDVILFGGLTDLLDKLRKTELVRYFRTSEARENNSRARQLVESAA